MSGAIGTVVSAFKRAVPLVVYESSDLAASVLRIEDAMRNGGVDGSRVASVVSWDIVGGVVPSFGDANSERIAKAFGGEDVARNPAFMFERLANTEAIAGRFVMILKNVQFFLEDHEIIQWLSNLRDSLKRLDADNKRILVLMGHAVKVPAELQHDVIIVDEPLPDVEQLKRVIRPICDCTPDRGNTEVIAEAARASIGVTAFAAENMASIALESDGLRVGKVWDAKVKKINQTPGLQVVTSGSFDEIGGCDAVKRFVSAIGKGKNRPNCIVFMDEIEKAFAGLRGDSTGTTQDQLGILLQYMQDRRARGAIFNGPPGAAKSAVAKAAGKECGIPTIQLDLGGLKGAYVGESEKMIRQALKIIDAISGENTLWLATCNSMAVLPPELRRRFKLGTWFFDLPTMEDRRKIWEIYAARYEIEDWERMLPLNLTGAEIENCCSMAYELGIDLDEAMKTIIPVAISSAEQIAALRASAEGKMICATHGGPYVGKQQGALAAGRAFEV